MKTLTKKFSITLLLIALLACFGLAAISLGSTAKAEPTAPAAPTATDFATEEGMYIRRTEPTGVRYGAAISKSYYDSLYAYYDAVELGMAIGHKNTISELKNAAESDNAHYLKPKATDSWSATNNPDAGSNEYKYYFTIKEIETTNYIENYTALAYAKVTKDSSTQIIWSVIPSGSDTATTRTPAQAAAKHIDIGDGDKSFAQAIINSVVSTAQLSFDAPSYTFNASNTNITPKVTLGGKEVKATITSSDTEKIDFDANGKLIAKALCSNVNITATIAGTNATATATVTVESLPATASLSVDGILTADTNGEAQTVTFYNDSTPAQAVTGNDVYDAIISYRETNSITAPATYTVKVESDSRFAILETATFTPISDMKGMQDEALASSANSNKYYYLTNDIEFFEQNNTGYINSCTIFAQKTNDPIYMNLDGRGYSFKLHIVSSSTGSPRIMFYRIDNSLFKNTTFDTNIEGRAHDSGILATYVHNSSFVNCYFKVEMKNLTEVTEPQAMFRNDTNNVYTNCLFNLIDATDDGYDIILSGRPDVNSTQTYNNCAVITTNSQVSDLFNETRNNPDYEELALFASEIALGKDWAQNGTLSDIWGIKEDTKYVTFEGKDIFSYDKKVLEVTSTANGVLSYDANGEAITVVVNDGASDIITETLPANTTIYDLYDAIISYREEEGITEAKAYSVELSNDSYFAEITTATFTVISDMAGMQAEALASSENSNKYYYLTNSIEFFEQNNTGYINSCTIFAQKTNAPIYMNFDGRGYSLKLHKASASTGSPRMMFYRIDKSSFINTVFDTNIEGSAHNSGILATYVYDSKFENCVFAVTMNTLTTPTRNQPIFRNNTRNEFTNCIFNIVDSTADEYGITISGAPDITSNQTYNNCAIVSSAAQVADLFADKNTVTNNGINLYSSIANLRATEKDNASWSGDLKVTETAITLCGNTVAAIS